MLITIKDIAIEKISKGKNNWETATVSYDFQGNFRQQKIVSFSNPAVFAELKKLSAGDQVEVVVTKNDQGFNQWATLTKPSGEPQKAPGAPATGKVTGSNYETREERAARQVLIVRQSCLAQAVTFHEGDDHADVPQVLGTAQRFVDWVFDKGDLFDQPDDLPED